MGLMMSETTVLVFHASSYPSHTHDMSNLVRKKMFVTLFCAIDRNVRGTFRTDGTKHSSVANNGRIGDLYGLPVRRSNDVAPNLCG